MERIQKEIKDGRIIFGFQHDTGAIGIGDGIDGNGFEPFFDFFLRHGGIEFLFSAVATAAAADGGSIFTEAATSEGNK